MAQGLVQDTCLCLENDVKGIKAARARILKSVLVSVWQLPLLHPAATTEVGISFLLG